MKKTVNKFDRSRSAHFRPKANELFEVAASKSQEQQLKIIEAAIRSFAKNGIEATTYTSLAKDCEISRPLIHHYFPTLEDLFLLTAKYVRQTLLNLAVAEMAKTPATDPRAQLEGYLKGCFRWVREFPDQFSFWLLYFYQASLKGQARDENSQLVKAGHERIEALLSQGNAHKVWVVEHPRETAKTIQIFITGALVSVMTEDGYLTLARAEILLNESVFRGLLRLE